MIINFSVSHIQGLSIKVRYIADATTMRLFLDMFKWVGLNPIGDVRKKGGVNMYMLMDRLALVGKFMKITEAEMHDNFFLKIYWCPDTA